MFTLLVFASGIVVGVVYEKQLRKYKEKVVAAGKAAQTSFKSS